MEHQKAIIDEQKRNKFFSLLGMARRAGKLSLGHDASIQSIVRNNAALCLVCEEASERLKNEFAHACSFEGKSVLFFVLCCTSEELSKAVGQKTSSLCVDDEGFAAALLKLTK